jgi:hypothetical protein
MKSMERGAEALCLPEIIVKYLRDEETNMELNGAADGQEKSAPISTRILQNRDENKGKNPGSEDRIPAKDETGPGSTTGPGGPEDKVLADKKTGIAHPVRNVERKTELQGTSVKLFHEDACLTIKKNGAGSQKSRLRDTLCQNGKSNTGPGVLPDGTPGPDEYRDLSRDKHLK